MMKKIENLLKTSYARITTSEEPNEKKWVFSSVHNRAFNYNSSALFEYVKKYHPEIQAFYVMEDPVERKKLQECFGKESIIDTSTMEGIRKVLECKVWFTSTAPPLYGMGFRKKYCIINLWHGVPLKKIGMEQENLGWFDNFFCRCFIVNEDSYNASPSKLANDMCGSGPYKFVSYTSGSNLVLEKNDDYWQNDELRHQEQHANVKNLTFQFVSENVQRVNGVATGSLDMVQDMAFESITDFVDGGQYADKANVQAYSQKFIYYLDPNCSEDSPMHDENLRKAVFYAIDQDGLITALGGAYSRLYAYANDYYSDYDMVDWANVDTYNSKTAVDPDAVKQYLDASDYNGEKLTLMVMSTFADTATIIAAQLAAYGINVELLQVDNATANATQADSTAWDMTFGMMAGDYNVQAWSHDFSYNNTSTGDRTTTFIVDDEWNDLLSNTEDGHTAENMQAWWEMAAEHAYTMGIYAGNNYNIVPEDCTYVCQGDKLRFLPGACCFKAE